MKVKIIGAGLAGLSTGIYLQQKGVDTEIFELAPWAGGVCTTWVRKGYRFDGCIHWMVGTKPGDGYYQLYREVGALDESTEIYNTGETVMEIGGRLYTIPLEYEKFKAFLLSVSPRDSVEIEKFCKDVEIMVNSKMPVNAPANPISAVRFLREYRGFLKVMPKTVKLTVGEYAERFQSETLKHILFSLMPKDFSAAALFMMLATRMSGNAGYPMGGALEVIKRMEEKYRSLGGKIQLNTKVDEITVENGRATGIKAKGVFYPADAVVAACDAYDTLKRMLGGKYEHPQLDSMLKNAPLFDPLAVVSFGLNRKFGLPYGVNYEVPEGFPVSPDTTQYGFGLRSFEFDPSSAPGNGSSVMVMTSAPFDYWNDLREKDPEEYKKQKQKLADSVAKEIDRRNPGFQDAIEVIDVATPATYKHLVNLYQGSFEGFAPVPSSLMTKIKKTVPGVKGLVLCGQWTGAGGGICAAIDSGKKTAEYLLKK